MYKAGPLLDVVVGIFRVLPGYKLVMNAAGNSQGKARHAQGLMELIKRKTVNSELQMSGYEDLVRQVTRAQRASPKSGDLRRNTLVKLLECTRDPQPGLRKFSVSHLKHFFSDFADLREQCIDAIYDICEDSESDVRLAGYKAICEASNSDKSLVRRNTDVLVQLLQTDEEKEVSNIKQCLDDHINIDATSSLQVLCDDCVPQNPSDTDEVADRARLRDLVLDFLATDGNGSVRAKCRPGEPAERTLITGLEKAIPFSNHNHSSRIVERILLPLRAFLNPSREGDRLLEVLLERTSQAVKEDHGGKTQPPNMTSTLAFLGLCQIVIQHNRTAAPLVLLRFICTKLLGNLQFSKMSPDAQRGITSCLARVLRIGLSDPSLKSDSGWDSCVRTAVDTSFYTLPSLVNAPALWDDISVLVQAIADRSDSKDWPVPPRQVDVLRDIQKSALADRKSNPDKAKVIELLKTAVEPQPEVKATTIKEAPLSFRNASQLEGNGSSSSTPIKRRRDDNQEDVVMRAFPPRPQPVSQTRSLASRLGPVSSTDNANQRMQALSIGEQPPQKKPRTDLTSVSSPPSLLQRMSADGGAATAKPKSPTEPPRSKLESLTATPSYGFHIKGAATSTTSPTSLQERLGQSEQVSSGSSGSSALQLPQERKRIKSRR